jgi:hypothetical protein
LLNKVYMNTGEEFRIKIYNIIYNNKRKKTFLKHQRQFNAS